jgi:hypothetical protein
MQETKKQKDGIEAKDETKQKDGMEAKDTTKQKDGVEASYPSMLPSTRVNTMHD